MSVLRSSKFYFEELLESGGRNQGKSWKKELLLEQIQEVSEKTSISLVNPEIGPGPRTVQNKTPFSVHNQTEEFFCMFLMKLARFPKLFKFFSNQADLEKNRVRISQTVKKINRPMIENSKILGSSESSVISDEIIPKSTSMRRAILCNKSFNFIRHRNEIPNTASSNSSSYGISTPINRFRSIRKIQILKPENPSLIVIFKKIAEEKTRINLEDFKKFLLARYPAPVCESICKHFKFKQTTYEDYITEMNKFITQGEERHLSFCFEIFDFNKDKLLTCHDAFTAMGLRTNNYYDEDLIALLDMFELKSEGKLKRPGRDKLFRRRSTFSIIKAKEENPDVTKEIKPQKFLENVSLNFKDFCKIKFNGRPQILLDFFLYTCDYNYLIEKGLIAAVPVHSAKLSEAIVVEMNVNPEFNERLRKSEKYEYYCALEAAMEMYSKGEMEDLLKKFKFLQSETHLRLKVISRESMIKKLVRVMQPDMLGYRNEYLSIRFYEYLSQGKDLTKAVFLTRVHSLLNDVTKLKINKFAFDLIDAKNDRKLTVDEVCRMFEALPIGSQVYHEFYP